MEFELKFNAHVRTQFQTELQAAITLLVQEIPSRLSSQHLKTTPIIQLKYSTERGRPSTFERTTYLQSPVEDN